MKNKKEVLKTSLFIIISYISIMLANNLKGIIGLFTGNLNNQINYLNLSIIFSLILIITAYIFRKILFKNKYHLWIVFCSLIFYNFAEGYVSDFVVFPFIILYVYILLLTYCLILYTKKSFEISAVIGFSILLLSAFVVGIFGILKIFKYLILISVAIMIIYIYKRYKEDKNSLVESRDKLFSSGFIIFNLIWIIAILGGAGMYVHSWDEYSHWAYDAKATIYYSKFGASQEIMSKSKGYAPIFTMWHYIIAIFNGFSEHNLYIGLNILIGMFLLPAFYWIKNKRILSYILAFVAIMFSCYLFGGVYSYSSLYSDYAITSIFASIMIMYEISKNEKINLTIPMILLFIILTLSKTNGFVIAFVGLTIMFFDEIISIKNLSLKEILKFIAEFIRRYWKMILSVIITFIIWKIYLVIMSKITTEYYDYVLLPETLMGDLKYKLNKEFIITFIKNVFYSFDDTLISCKIKLSLYQFLIVLFTCLFLVFYYEVKEVKKALKKLIPYIIGYALFFFLTVLSMFVMMSKYEASILASFGRYLNWYHLGIVIFLLAYILKFDNSKSRLSFVPIVYITIVTIIPFSTISYFMINPIRSESYDIYLKRTSEFKIINKNVPKDAMVYVIDQKDKDGIMAMWYARYYAFPRQNNASSSAINWKIKTSKNKDDLQDWGLTAKDWVKQLEKYKFDYVYLYSTDKEFFKETEFLYDDANTAKKSKLFKISINDNNLKLTPIE